MDGTGVQAGLTPELMLPAALLCGSGSHEPLGVFILWPAAVGYMFHSEHFNRKQQALRSRVFSHFFFQSSGAGIRMFFKPHCPRLDSQEEVAGSLEKRT